MALAQDLEHQPLERLNREGKRRTASLESSPKPAALPRLSTCVLIEAHDGRQYSDRRHLFGGTLALLTPPA